MANKESFSISDFAKFARTTRDTLLFYDKINLLRPAARGKRGYRFYSANQVAVVNIIRTAQQLGFSLSEIKKLIEERNPAMIDELMIQQIGRIDEKINEWLRARKLLSVLQQMIHTALAKNINTITVEFLPAEAIILGEINDYSKGRDDYDALLSFYHACSEKYPDTDLNYPVWAMFSEDQIRRRHWSLPDRYYFYNPAGPDERPAALYAIGYCKGGYGDSAELFKQLLAYIDTNGYQVCGPAYEEYPLNEISVPDASNYLIRVLITVQKRAD
jgi:DNA-binding transcriptional MerR regulator